MTDAAAPTVKPPRPAVLHPDGRLRCGWPGFDPVYVEYHDTEWGVPERDSRALYEKLILDGFQAGLSWITILRKREAFRAAFAGFAPEKVASFTPADVERLLLDPGIVRHRGKIEGAIKNAQGWIAIEEREGFSHYLWKHFEGRAQQNRYRDQRDVPVQTPLSARISKDLKKAGFTFCGPTIVYAFMEATGFFNDHLVECFRHDECAALAEA
ncbi:MAG: DNA-3-methyladenine glycosylase I [Bosea sp. (in: a-proteobacteria)]